MKDRYLIRERPRLGIFEVIDLEDKDEPVVFAGIAEDCEEWVNNPEGRDPGKEVPWT